MKSGISCLHQTPYQTSQCTLFDLCAPHWYIGNVIDWLIWNSNSQPWAMWKETWNCREGSLLELLELDFLERIVQTLNTCSQGPWYEPDSSASNKVKRFTKVRLCQLTVIQYTLTHWLSHLHMNGAEPSFTYVRLVLSENELLSFLAHHHKLADFKGEKKHHYYNTAVSHSSAWSETDGPGLDPGSRLTENWAKCPSDQISNCHVNQLVLCMDEWLMIYWLADGLRCS